jgi:hypothetical protein
MGSHSMFDKEAEFYYGPVDREITKQTLLGLQVHVLGPHF